MSGFVVTFVTRRGCVLCDEARPVVERAVTRSKGSMSVIDVDSDSAIAAAYGDRVPVVLAPDGSVITEGRISRRRLRSVLRSLRRKSR